MDDSSLDDFLDGDADGEDGAEEARPDDGAAVTDDEPADGTITDDESAADEGDDAEGATSDDEGSGRDDEPAAGAGPAEGVEPATSTYAWSSDPVACEACGETVRRRWREEGGLVCRDCKEW